MSDLVERLRKKATDGLSDLFLRDEAAARIEALEAALKAIADPDNCFMLAEVEEIARAALAEEQDK